MQKLTGTERKDTSPQVAGMEGHVNTGERDGSEAAVQLDVAILSLLLLERLLVARLDDFSEHLLDLLDGESLSQLQKESEMLLCDYRYKQTLAMSIFLTLR